MGMLKKYLTIAFLILTIAVSGCTIATAEEKPAATYHLDAVNFAVETGMLYPDADGNIILSNTLTRAEMAGMLRRIIRAEAIPNAKLTITDMDASDPMYGDVAAVIQAGLVKEPESGLFRPNEPAFAYQLVGSLLDILGYRSVIGMQNDWTVASRLGLFGDLSLGEKDVLNWSQAAELCYNAMYADMMIQVQYGDDAKYIKTEDANIFTQYWHATRGIGVVDGNEKTGLTVNAELDKGYVTIDGTVYKAGETDAADYIGYQVEFWYTSDNTLVYLKKLDNNVIKISAKNIERAERNQLLYYPSEGASSVKTAKLAKDVDVLYNGRALFEYTEADLKPQTGYVELIDYDANGLYDVVSVMEYTNYYITAMDSENQLVVDGLRNKTVDLDATNKVCVEIKNWQEDIQDMQAISLESLTPKGILSFIESRDGQYIVAVQSKAKVQGTITTVKESNGGMQVTINDKAYEVSADFLAQYQAGNTKAIKPEPGMAAIAYLDFYGEVAYISTDLSDWQYGFMSNCSLQGTFNQKLLLRVLNDEGLWEEKEVADKLIFKGDPYKNHEKVYDALCTGGVVQPQIIRYQLRPDGKIANLETAEAAASMGYDENKFSKDAVLTDTKYKSGDKAFGHQYSYELTTTTMFYIPEEMLDGTKKVDEDEIALLGSTYFVSDRKYNLEVYDSDPYYIPRVMVFTGYSVENYEKDILFVNEKATILDGNGEQTYLLTGYMANTLVEYVCKKKEIAEQVEVGDALKICLASDGRINKLSRVVNFSNPKSTGTELSIGTNVEKSISDEHGFLIGTVYNVDYERKAILANTTSETELKKFSGSSMKVLIYDTEEKEFRPGDVTQAQGKLFSSSPSRIFAHDRYMETRSLVIIE